MISPREYFKALEQGDQRLEAEGAALLRRACAAAPHADVFAARDDRSGGALSDLIQDYLVFLYSEEGQVQRLQIDDWPGVTVSFARFLKRLRRRDKSLERQRGLYRELLFDKIRKVLRHDQRFSSVPPPSPARFHLSAPPARLENLGEDDLRRRLPLLASRLDPAGKSSPQVVKRVELADQLERIFALTGNEPRTPHAVLDCVWATLNPQPEEAARYALRAEDEGALDMTDRLTGEENLQDRSRAHDATDEQAAGLEFLEERVDELASGFVKSLSPRCAHVAYVRWAAAEGDRMRTLEDVARITGIARSTVDRDFNEFQSLLAAWIERHRLEGRDAEVLVEVIRETLSTGAFHPWERGNM